MRYNINKPSPGTPLLRGDMLNVGLTAFWPMWEGAGRAAYDIAGGTWDTTAVGTVSWSGAASGGLAPYFATSSDYFDTVDLFLPSGADTPLTLSVLFRTTVTGVQRDIVSLFKSGDATRAAFRITTGNVVELWKISTRVASTISVCDGKWHHVTLVKRGSGTGQLELWIDGTLNATGTDSAGFTQTSPANVRIGYLTGWIDHVRYWAGTALSAIDVQQLHAAPWSMFVDSNSPELFAVSGAPGFKAAWAAQTSRIIGSGVR